MVYDCKQKYQVKLNYISIQATCVNYIIISGYMYNYI